MSLWNCMRKRLQLAPPSARSPAIGKPASRSITSMMSLTEKAIPSSVARTMCALVVPRVNPRIAPRAYMSHSGAPRPVKAGTTTTPPLSGTEPARVSVSAESLMMPSPSRNHCTAAPAMNTLPSRAYVTLPPSLQATVDNMPCVERTMCSPVLTRIKLPVPYVTFTSPVS